MRKSQAVPLTVTAMLAAALTGCADEPPPDNYAICVNPQTEMRVEDQRCDDGHGGGIGGFALLYFAGMNNGRVYDAPAVGRSYRLSGGTPVRPTGTTQLGGISATGGQVFKGSPAVSRGGFGKVGGGGSGGGGKSRFGG